MLYISPPPPPIPPGKIQVQRNFLWLNMLSEKEIHFNVHFRRTRFQPLNMLSHVCAPNTILKFGRILLNLFLFPQTLLQTLSTSRPNPSIFKLPHSEPITFPSSHPKYPKWFLFLRPLGCLLTYLLYCTAKSKW